MEYILLWLLLGQAAYMVALSLKVYDIAYKTGYYKNKINARSFFLGLAAVLLGPICFFLIDYKRDHQE